MQDANPVRFPYVPTGHCNTEVAFGQYDPFGHKVHFIEPRSSAIDPAWQSSQALKVVWPVLFPNFPAGHSDTEVAFGQYEPFVPSVLHLKLQKLFFAFELGPLKLTAANHE